MKEKLYAKFSTSRLRAAIAAPIATLLAALLAPRNLDFGRYPALTVIVDLFFLLFLALAVRAWIVVLRGPVNVRLAAEGMTMRRGRREVTLAWVEVGLVRIVWQKKTPWVVVWLDDAVPAERILVSRQQDGSYRVLPIGRGRSMRSRLKQIGRFRSEIMGYAGRYVDVA